MNKTVENFLNEVEQKHGKCIKDRMWKEVLKWSNNTASKQTILGERTLNDLLSFALD